jgi:hypothetical protein
MARLTLGRLGDLEELRQLKARYARLVDSQDWAGLRLVLGRW